MAQPPPAVRSLSWSTISPTSDFYYRPSAEILSGIFRIVKVLPGRYEDPVTCRLQEVSIRDNTIPFVALSYCWNSAVPEVEIWCDDHPIKITENLFSALRNARATNNPVNLWIDQLCIDQGNIIDRNEQVSKMGAIYSAASGVVVWLGEEGRGTSAAMELPKRIARYWPTLFKNPGELTDASKTPPQCPKWGQDPWPAFALLLERPWFKRLWILQASPYDVSFKTGLSAPRKLTTFQEIACAKNALVTCGKATAFWDDFVNLVEVVEKVHHTSAQAYDMLGLKTTKHYIGFMQRLRSITNQGSKQAVRDYASQDSLAPYVLTMAKDCEATDHRDKLFAFHHIVRLWNRPDYRIEIGMLYKLFAVQYLERIAYAISEFSCDEQALYKRQLGIIYSAGACNQRLEGCPSWVPDWSVPWLARPLWLGSDCYGAGGSDVKEIAPTTEVDVVGNPLFRLTLTVKFSDKIVASGSHGLFLTKSNPRSLIDSVRAWIFSALSLLHVHRSVPRRYGDANEAMARTVAADQDHGSRLAPEQAVAKYDALLDVLREADEEAEASAMNIVSVEAEGLVSSAATFLRGRVFFLTETGHFGLAQEGVVAGDRIAIIQGAPVPVVVRPREQDYALQCEAFVLGIMNGEVWNDATISAEDITLV